VSQSWVESLLFPNCTGEKILIADSKLELRKDWFYWYLGSCCCFEERYWCSKLLEFSFPFSSLSSSWRWSLIIRLWRASSFSLSESEDLLEGLHSIHFHFNSEFNSELGTGCPDQVGPLLWGQDWHPHLFLPEQGVRGLFQSVQGPRNLFGVQKRLLWLNVLCGMHAISDGRPGDPRQGG